MVPIVEYSIEFPSSAPSRPLIDMECYTYLMNAFAFVPSFLYLLPSCRSLSLVRFLAFPIS
jgi:hypothetical protein